MTEHRSMDGVEQSPTYVETTNDGNVPDGSDTSGRDYVEKDGHTAAAEAHLDHDPVEAGNTREDELRGADTSGDGYTHHEE